MASRRSRERGDKRAVTAEDARALLHYDPCTGAFTWRHRGIEYCKNAAYQKAWNTRFAGKPAGRVVNGYLTIAIFGVAYGAHRLAWLIAKGNWPAAYIDHIDGAKTNNAIANLRDVAPCTNSENTRIPRMSKKSGLPLGVFRNGKSALKPFYAAVKADHKTFYVGQYETAEEAHLAYIHKKRTLHAGCTL